MSEDLYRPAERARQLLTAAVALDRERAAAFAAEVVADAHAAETVDKLAGVAACAVDVLARATGTTREIVLDRCFGLIVGEPDTDPDLGR